MGQGAGEGGGKSGVSAGVVAAIIIILVIVFAISGYGLYKYRLRVRLPCLPLTICSIDH